MDNDEAIIPYSAKVSRTIEFDLGERGPIIKFTFPYAVSDDIMTLSLINDTSVLPDIISNKLVRRPSNLPEECPEKSKNIIFWFTPKTSKTGDVRVTIPDTKHVLQWIYEGGAWRWQPLHQETEDTWIIKKTFYCYFCRC
jgi:hypothetical protein